MINQNAPGGTGNAPNVAENSSMEEAIKRLTEEKRVLEEKNKKLAVMLNICAKNANSGANASASQGVGSTGEINELKEQVLALKKYVSESQKKLEKDVTEQSSSQWNAVMGEMKARFSAIEGKIATIDNIKAVQKKLDELEASVRDKKRRGGNPFGMLGVVGGEAPNIPALETHDEDKELADKIDELEEKIERLGSRISAVQKPENRNVEKAERVIHKVENKIEGIIPTKMKEELAKIAAVFSRERSIDLKPVPEDPPKRAASPSTITFKPAEEMPEKPAYKSAGFMQPWNLPKRQEEAEKPKIQTPKPQEDAGQAQEMRIKLHDPSDLSDIPKMQEDIRAGDILLVNIKSLKQNDIELLKRIIEQAKRTSNAVDGNITGIGDNHLIIMPKNVELHKGNETK